MTLPGWTGLTVSDAKHGIELAGAALTMVDTECGPMVCSVESLDALPAGCQTDELLLLPGFDEYLLGYKDRSVMLAAEHANLIVPGGNGVFKPTIVAKGRVIGTWKRDIKAHRSSPPLPFGPFTNMQRHSIRERRPLVRRISPT